MAFCIVGTGSYWLGSSRAQPAATVQTAKPDIFDQVAPKMFYVASSLRGPFHRIDCKWAKRISQANLQTFATREEAIAAGHTPCKTCQP